MQRSKQHALMFLLGAMLVGGVVGFSADRAYEHYKRQKEQKERWLDRPSFFDDLGFTAQQRAAWAEISDSTNCRTMLRTAVIQPGLDSIRERGLAQLRAVMTPEQIVRWEARQQAMRDGRGRGGGRGDQRNDGRAGPAPSEGGRGEVRGSSGQQQGQTTTRRQRREAELEACRVMLKEQKIQ